MMARTRRKPSNPAPQRDPAVLTLVLAGSHEQARFHAERLGLTQWRSVQGVEELYGRRGARILRVGQWWARKDRQEVMDVALSQQMIVEDAQ